MNSKKITILLFAFSIIGLVAGWVLKNSTNFGFCLISEPTCINDLSNVGDALFYGMGALALVFVLLFFIPKAFSLWWKFAIWFVPLSAILFATWQAPSGGGWGMIGGNIGPDSETVFKWVSGFYVVVSLGIIGWAGRR